MPRSKRSFGGIRKLPSGRYQANFTGPDARLHKAPNTFDSREDAEAWLTDVRRQISRGEWSPKRSAPRSMTFAQFAEMWMGSRPLRPRTRQHYQRLLDQQLIPVFGDATLPSIDADDVRDWWLTMGTSRPTLRSHAYGLLRTMMGTALLGQLFDTNPCHIRGAGRSKRVHKIKPGTLEELETLVSALPRRYRAMALLAAWCSLRFGELTELRRKDIDQTNGIIHVRRGVVRTPEGFLVGLPKSDAGIRDVAIPPHLLPLIVEHIKTDAQTGPEGLLFPSNSGGHMAPSSLYRVYYPARKAAGRQDLRWHDLRHSGAVLAAQAGATLAELMGRLGHSTPSAALVYQHAAQARDVEIAKRLSAMVHSPPTVTP